MADKFTTMLQGGGFNPYKGFMQPGMQQQFQDAQMFDTFMGLLGGYGNSLYKGYSPTQKIFNTIVGGYTGSQNTVDRFGKILQAQTGLTKDRLDIAQKGMQNQELMNKMIATKELVDNSNDPFLKRAYNINPGAITKAVYESNYAKMPRLSGDDFFIAKALGYDINNMSQEQAQNIMKIRQGMSPKDYADLQINIANIKKDIPSLADQIPPGYTQNDAMNQVIRNDLVNKVNQFSQGNQGGYRPPTYMPGYNVNIPSTDVLSNKPSFTASKDAEFVGGGYTPPSTTNKQPVNQTEQYFAKQNQIQNIIDLNNQISQNTGIQGLTSDYQYSPKFIQKMMDSKLDNQVKYTQMFDDFNNTLESIDQLTNHAGFDKLFSAGGFIQGKLSRDAIQAKSVYDNIISKGVLNKLVNMKINDPNGATPFGQMNYSELRLVYDSFIKLKEAGGDPTAAKLALSELKENMKLARGYMMQKSQGYYGDELNSSYPQMYEPDNLVGPGGRYVATGKVLQGQYYGMADNLRPDVYYVVMEDGTYIPVPNQKTGGNLTRQDYYKRNY